VVKQDSCCSKTSIQKKPRVETELARHTQKSTRFLKMIPMDTKDRDYKLDITWLRDESLEDSDELPEPQDLASEAITELEAVVDDLREIVALVEKEEGVEK
jgi:hypothetical protein